MSETAKKVLVIDDELGPRESLKMLLKDKYTVTAVDSGDKGIEHIKNTGADAVILDLKMPGKGGIETLKEIRKFDSKTPVIILTGYGDINTAKEAIHLGTAEFISKPFDIKEMQDIVKKACDKKEMADKTENLIRELGLLNSSMQEKMSRIENMATIGQLSSEIIHDVNNLLTVIYGYIQLLIAEADMETRDFNRKYISIIEEEIKKCKKITNSVVELSKIRMKVQPVNINAVISKVVDFFKNSSAAKNITFSLSTDDSIPFVNADPVQLHKAFVNIVLNAIQSIEQKGEIIVSTKKQDSNIAIRVKDSGRGIEESIRGRIFEPSFTTKEDGTGLGLSITMGVIQKHNGTIEVNSAINKGTTVAVYLPIEKTAD